jgi:sugar (pentulose or hexulose) kinase
METGIRPSAKVSLFRMMVQPHDGERGRVWLQVADWLIYRWSRGARVTHANLAARTMALDWNRRAWSSNLLSFAEVSERDLPEILFAPVVAAHFRDGPKNFLGSALVHAGQDHACAYYGARLPSGVAMDSSGTAEPWVIEETRPILTAESWAQGMMWAPSVSGSGYSGLLPTPGGGAAERWAREVFGRGSGLSVKPAVVFDPDGFGDGLARFSGVGRATRADEFYDAVLVGLADALGHKLNALRKICGRPLKEVAWVGGAVRHRQWAEMRSSRMGAKLWAHEMGEAAALGALLAAAAALGHESMVPTWRWLTVPEGDPGQPDWLGSSPRVAHDEASEPSESV